MNVLRPWYTPRDSKRNRKAESFIELEQSGGRSTAVIRGLSSLVRCHRGLPPLCSQPLLPWLSKAVWWGCDRSISGTSEGSPFPSWKSATFWRAAEGSWLRNSSSAPDTSPTSIWTLISLSDCVCPWELRRGRISFFWRGRLVQPT